MDFNKFTIKAQESVQQAQQIAQSYGHQQIENSHILKAIFEVDENVVPFIFKKIGLNIDLLKSLIDKTLESYSKVTGGDISFSGNASKMLNTASTVCVCDCPDSSCASPECSCPPVDCVSCNISETRANPAIWKISKP